MDDAKPPSLFRPNTDSLRVMSALAQEGQATAVDTPDTYFSKSWLQPRQRYS